MVYHSEHLRMISTHIHTLANVASPALVSHACAGSKTWTDPGIKLPEQISIIWCHLFGFRSTLSTNTVGVSIFGQDFNKRSTTKSLNDYASADITLHATSHRLRIHKDDACTTIPLSCMVFNKSLNKDKNRFSSVV